MGEKPSVISAIVKYHHTERMRRLVNDAMDVLGGRGICLGRRNFLGHVYQAIPISITVEGANILTRSLIIFGQGAIRCHPYILKEMKAAADPDPVRASMRFDRALFHHIGFFFRNVTRSLFTGLTGGRLVSVPSNGPASNYYRQLTRMSTALALTSDMAMLVLGGALKRRESISARLGDVLSYLYLASASLKRFKDQGSPPEDLPLLHWACEYCLYNIQVRLGEVIRNFPSRPVAWLLRFLVFPTGMPYKGPSDKLNHQVAGLLLEPSEVRDRLTSGIYLPRNHEEPLEILEVALKKTIEAETVEKKLRKAVQTGALKATDPEALLQEAVKAGVIDKEDADLVRSAEEARREAIRVDDFPQDYWKRNS